jgi:transposase
MAAVTVLAGAERRRRWSAAEKLRIVEESLAIGASVAEVARRHDVHPNLVHLWRRQARTGIVSPMLDGATGFVPVSIAGDSSVACPMASGDGIGSVIEVVLRNGRVLRLSERAAPARAALLADALEGSGR